jgi:hypothetical protein
MVLHIFLNIGKQASPIYYDMNQTIDMSCHDLKEKNNSQLTYACISVTRCLFFTLLHSN